MAVPTTVSDQRRDHGDDGVTLVEMSVVLIVLVVLVGLGLTALLGARERMNRSAAKSEVTTAAKTHRVFLADRGEYSAPSDVETLLKKIEPSLEFRPYTDPASVAADTGVRGVVYYKDAAGEAVTLMAQSPEGTCYWLHDDGKITTHTATKCADPAPAPPFDNRW